MKIFFLFFALTLFITLFSCNKNENISLGAEPFSALIMPFKNLKITDSNGNITEYTFSFDEQNRLIKSYWTDTLNYSYNHKSTSFVQVSNQKQGTFEFNTLWNLERFTYNKDSLYITPTDTINRFYTNVKLYLYKNGNQLVKIIDGKDYYNFVWNDNNITSIEYKQNNKLQKLELEYTNLDNKNGFLFTNYDLPFADSDFFINKGFPSKKLVQKIIHKEQSSTNPNDFVTQNEKMLNYETNSEGLITKITTIDSNGSFIYEFTY